MRRIMLVLTATALMVFVMAATALPAMATKVPPDGLGNCGKKGLPFVTFGNGNPLQSTKAHCLHKLITL